MRVRLHWATPVGPVEDVRDFRLTSARHMEGCVGRSPAPNVPAQVIPVNYLRWDLVSGAAARSGDRTMWMHPMSASCR